MLPPHIPHYPAPAKLNLDLRIIRQRPDGYHDIESLFTLINLADTLAIAPRRDHQIILHTPPPHRHHRQPPPRGPPAVLFVPKA